MQKRRGDAPQGYLFRFAPLRGHRPLRFVLASPPLRNVYRGACGETDEGAALRAAPCFRFYARPLFMRSCSLSAIMAMNSELVGLPLAEFTV